MVKLEYVRQCSCNSTNKYNRAGWFMTSSETYYKMKLNLEGFKNVQGLMLLRTVNAGFPPPHPPVPSSPPPSPSTPFLCFGFKEILTSIAYWTKQMCSWDCIGWVQSTAVSRYIWQQWHKESKTQIDQMKQPGLVNSALIFNTTYNWYSISRKYNHHSPRLTEELERNLIPCNVLQGLYWTQNATVL